MADRVATSRSELITRVLAAALIVASGVVHLQQYYGVYYRVIPTIGPLFLADFVLALLIAIALLAPVARISAPLATLVKVGAILFAAGAIAGLEISESGTLFGFHEHGYRLAVVLSIIFEAGAIVVLVASLMAQRRGRRMARASAPGDAVSWPNEPRSTAPLDRTTPRATR
jgi:hypothetical protein